MVNCAKCGTPNPDESSLCLACGAPLAGQKFALALDRARATGETEPLDSAPEPEQEPSPAEDAPPDAGRHPDYFDAGSHSPVSRPSTEPATQQEEPASNSDLDADTAKAEAPQARASADHLIASVQSVHKEVQDEQSPRHPADDETTDRVNTDNQAALPQPYAESKKIRIIQIVAVIVSATAMISYYVIRAKRHSRNKAAVNFVNGFQTISNETLAGFWRCVGGNAKPLHQAKDNLEVSAVIKQASLSDPNTHTERIRHKCLPMLAAARGEFARLTPPKELSQPYHDVVEWTTSAERTFSDYANKLRSLHMQRRREKRIVNEGRSFHRGRSTAGYVHFASCAVPRLAKRLSKVRKPPSAQPIVEYLYRSCKAKPRYGDRLRSRCYKRLKRRSRSKRVRFIAKKLRGDARDIAALEYCFELTNRDALTKDVAQLGHTWVTYRNALKALMDRITSFVKHHELSS